ncbi:MAG: inositol monophosphatase family protein [Candidatus Thorarchaeota archaeon]
MSLVHLLKKSAQVAKKLVLENLEISTERTGEMNQFGDKTLVLDMRAEKTIMEELSSSGLRLAFMTEEQGIIADEEKPEYLAVIDPIDGSANLERGIPLVSVGISLLPYTENLTTDDVEISIIDSFFTEETYVAISGEGVTLNGKRVTSSKLENPKTAIISYDTKKSWKGVFGQQSLRTIEEVHDVRRTGSNLLDLCWTASGGLDAMIDLRGILPLVHVSGTHMVFEAGGFVANRTGERFALPMDLSHRMSFIAAGTESMARKLAAYFNSVTS